MNPWTLAADKIAGDPPPTDLDADREYFDLLIEVAVQETPGAQQLSKERIRRAVQRAETSMGWPTSDAEMRSGLDTSLMIHETLRRCGDNLRDELQRTGLV